MERYSCNLCGREVEPDDMRTMDDEVTVRLENSIGLNIDVHTEFDAYLCEECKIRTLKEVIKAYEEE
jgi:hypothetical protein